MRHHPTWKGTSQDPSVGLTLLLDAVSKLSDSADTLEFRAIVDVPFETGSLPSRNKKV